MNNLVVFGDSFSTNFTNNNSVKIEDSWPVLLSEKLDLNLINHSLPGACNGEITNKFFKHYEDISNNDIVILEIGFFNRILEQFSGTTFMLGYDNERFDKLDFEFYSRKTLDLDVYIKQDLIKFQFIFEYLNKRNIKFLVWCIDGILDAKLQPYSYSQLYEFIYKKFSDNIVLFDGKFSLMDEVIEKNPNFWVNKSDKHFNKLGHEFFFLYLYDIVIGNKIKKII
jgi:hypothetical protein